MTQHDGPNTYLVHDHRGSDESLPVRIVMAVAALRETDPKTLPPLAEAIDPDGLAGVIDSLRDTSDGTGDGFVEFAYDGCTVRVRANGDVTIRSEADGVRAQGERECSDDDGDHWQDVDLVESDTDTVRFEIHDIRSEDS